MRVAPLRLMPWDDLRRALEAWMGEQEEKARLISAVGSLSVVQLRLAGADEPTTIRGDLEILSLSGTLSPDGAHLHIAVAGSKGAVIGLLPEWQFSRELDPATGYAELQIRSQPEQ